MTKAGFHKLFVRALRAATDGAEMRLAKPLSRSIRVELHAPGSPGRTMSIDDAVEQIYLGDDRFYKVIDIAVRRILPDGVAVFVRVSGHPPVPFSQTWDPAKFGPFKPLVAETIEDRAVPAI